jgi:hypothetical protein
MPDGARARFRAPSGVRAGVVAVFVACLLRPGDAAAYCRTAACVPAGVGDICSPIDPMRESPDCVVPLFWKERCIGYSIQRDGSRSVSPDVAKDLVKRAFDAWTNADCGGARPNIAVERQPDASCGVPVYNLYGGNANVIMFRDDGWPYLGASETLGLATLTFDGDTGEIYDVDIELNTTDFTFTTGDSDVGFDLAATLQHETGHFFGISHSVFEDATMYFTPTEGSTAGRELLFDDVDAICAAYPPEGSEPGARCSPFPHEFSGSCQGTPDRRPDAPARNDGGCSVTAPWPARESFASLAWVAAIFAIRRRAARHGPSRFAPSEL